MTSCANACSHGGTNQPSIGPEEAAAGQVPVPASLKRKRDAEGPAKASFKDLTELSFRQRARMADLSLLLDVVLKTTGSRSAILTWQYLVTRLLGAFHS